MEQGEETRHLIEAAGSLNGTIEDLRTIISKEGFDIDQQYPPMGLRQSIAPLAATGPMLMMADLPPPPTR